MSIIRLYQHLCFHIYRPIYSLGSSLENSAIVIMNCSLITNVKRLETFNNGIQFTIPPYSSEHTCKLFFTSQKECADGYNTIIYERNRYFPSQKTILDRNDDTKGFIITLHDGVQVDCSKCPTITWSRNQLSYYNTLDSIHRKNNKNSISEHKANFQEFERVYHELKSQYH